MGYALTHKMTKAQQAAAHREAISAASSIQGVQEFAADLEWDDLASAIIATLEARPDATCERLEALEQRVGRIAWQRGRV